VLAPALALLLAAGHTSHAKLPLRQCVVQSLPAKCGTLVVPENRDTVLGRRIGLRVVVVPAQTKPARRDAFTYLAGGPGGAASEMTSAVVGIWTGVHERHDIVLVDQRGTGSSHPLECAPPAEKSDDVGAIMAACLSTINGDPTQYGTAAAADDLEAVRVALGYPRLNVYGTSYGATLAQVYLARHPRSVRTVTLDGGTLLDVPFFERFAANGQRALDQIAMRCAASRPCARAFPDWPSQLHSLIAAWNGRPRRIAAGRTLTGDDLAGVIQSLTLNASLAASVPFVVSRAAAGVYAPLLRSIPSASASPMIFWPIWCSERWVGLGPRGPWGTYLDGYVASQVDFYRSVCAYVPRFQEPASNLTRVRSRVPLLALVGGADPQDPIGNLAGLHTAMPNSRRVIVPGQGHAIGQYGCLPNLVARFVDRGSAAKLDVRCSRKIATTPFVLP
jgi:pimeloyl-ACP methyl ester carboxylesterase